MSTTVELASASVTLAMVVELGEVLLMVNSGIRLLLLSSENAEIFIYLNLGLCSSELYWTVKINPFPCDSKLRFPTEKSFSGCLTISACGFTVHYLWLSLSA